MQRRTCTMVALAVAVSFLGWGGGGPAQAKTLADRLAEGARFPGLQVTDDSGQPVITADPAATTIGGIGISRAFQSLAIRGTDFPVASTVPGFSYVYDPQLQAFTRSKSLGPVFAERTSTVGQNRFEVGANYLYADLDQIDGNGDFTATGVNFLVDKATNKVQPVLLYEKLDVTSFRLAVHSVNVYATYGITDRWDVNLLLPLEYSDLRVRGGARYRLVGPQKGVPFTGFTQSVPFKVDGNAFGVGDLLVRSKYRLVEGDVGVAAALTVRVPTGNEGNFQGLGDVTVTPTLIVEAPIGPVSVHGTAGIEFNADDLERTRARYTVGGAYQLLDNLALLVDVLGSSSFVADKLGNDYQFSASGIDVGGSSVPNIPRHPEVPQQNIVDLATGLKVSMGANAVFYVGAIVPLTQDGMRAQVIPTGGVEVGF